MKCQICLKQGHYADKCPQKWNTKSASFCKHRSYVYKLSLILARKFKPASQAIIFFNLKFLLKELGSFVMFKQMVSQLIAFDASQVNTYYGDVLQNCSLSSDQHWSSLGPIGYHPIDNRTTAAHLAWPVVMFMSFSRNPSAYGMMPAPDTSRDQKYSPRSFVETSSSQQTSFLTCTKHLQTNQPVYGCLTYSGWTWEEP